jgi:hypothetical protein
LRRLPGGLHRNHVGTAVLKWSVENFLRD